MLLIILVILGSSFDRILCVCPDKHLIAPCTCDDDEFVCDGIEGSDLDPVFERMEKNLKGDEKQFDYLLLNNITSTELKENQFRDLIFTAIFIENNEYLQTIHENAFTHTNQISNQVYFDNNPLLTFSTGSIYSILNQFKKLDKFSLKDSNVEIITSNAIKSEENLLKSLEFWGPSFKIIENSAFSLLTKLKSITFRNTSIESIPENAFHFDESSDSRIVLIFDSNSRINSSSLASNALLKTNRPVKLVIQNTLEDAENSWNSLDENIFTPFLKCPGNSITHYSINCNNCGNKWLVSNLEILQGQNLNCSNGNNLADPINFAGC